MRIGEILKDLQPYEYDNLYKKKKRSNSRENKNFKRREVKYKGVNV